MAEFRKERVLFHVVGQGSLEVEYEVGAETPEQRFRSLYDVTSRPGRRSLKNWRLAELLKNADGFDFVVTVATEPDERAMGMADEREGREMERVAEDEDDQFRTHR